MMGLVTSISAIQRTALLWGAAAAVVIGAVVWLRADARADLRNKIEKEAAERAVNTMEAVSDALGNIPADLDDARKRLRDLAQ